MELASRLLIGCLLSLTIIVGGCRIRNAQAGDAVVANVGPAPETRIDLARYGLPRDYNRFDDDDCTSHVIGYRFVTWISRDLVAIGFNTSPSCRSNDQARVSGGVARVLVFDTKGSVTARRDIPYDADGGDELVSSGEAGPGPEGTLLFRIEEAGKSKSGVLLLDENLKDVVCIDRFLEHVDFFTHALAFQDGFTWTGPRTYGVLEGREAKKTQQITRNLPAGTMDRKVGSYGDPFITCKQELKPGVWVDTKIVYAGAHRRCMLNVIGLRSDGWSVPLQHDEVAEIVGVREDGSVVGIVRAPKTADRLVVWSPKAAVTSLPWFPSGYDTKLVAASDEMGRYLGNGESCENECRRSSTRWMVVDTKEQKVLVDRTVHEQGAVALSPDGMRYASFEAGELRIYGLANGK